MKKIHFTDRYLLNPSHPVTVFVIGAGGTGSQVITNLARMSMALQALGHPGLHVTVFDPDTVSQANIGRQLFSETELGLNKAVSLVTRINRFFGYAWTAEPQCFPTRNFSEDSTANIIITCTDNIRSRLTLWKFLKKVRKENFSDHSAPIYWMDFGNSQTKGQVIIGTVREKVLQPSSQEYIPMPKMNVITEEVDYAKIKEKESGPSCSLAEALEKQDLFINSTLAHIGCDLLWKMFKGRKNTVSRCLCQSGYIENDRNPGVMTEVTVSSFLQNTVTYSICYLLFTMFLPRWSRKLCISEAR